MANSYGFPHSTISTIVKVNSKVKEMANLSVNGGFV